MKLRIEFYQDVLKPSQDKASLRLLWQVSLGILVLWGLAFSYTLYSAHQVEQQNIALQAAVSAGEREAEQMANALAELKARQQSGEKEQVERNIASRQELLQVLDLKHWVSYANTLQDLAHIPWQGVALQGLTLQGKQMVLRGEAAQASAVPAWILGFEQSDSLRGHRFGQLAISQRPEGGLSFSLTSSEAFDEEH